MALYKWKNPNNPIIMSWEQERKAKKGANQIWASCFSAYQQEKIAKGGD